MINRKSDKFKMNIDVYIKNEDLMVRFDIVNEGCEVGNFFSSFKEPILDLKNLSVMAEEFARDGNMKEDGYDYYAVDSKRIVGHLLQISPKKTKDEQWPKPIWQLQKNLNTLTNHLYVIYPLSHIPHRLINWIALISVYINNLNEHYALDYIQFHDHQYFKDTPLDNIVKKFYAQNFINFAINKLMEKIISFKDKLLNKLERYQQAIHHVDELLNYYNTILNEFYDRRIRLPQLRWRYPKSLLQVLFETSRARILYPIENINFNLKTAKEKECDFLMSLIEANSIDDKIEILFKIDCINTSQKMILLEPCIGKQGAQSHCYTYRFSEFKLIYFGEFYLFPDGKMAIINLDKNPAYIEHYAPTMKYHNDINKEFKLLASYLHLEIDFNCDIHQTKMILFTKDSSIELVNRGLHLNARYFKNLYHAYQLWALFTRYTQAENNGFSGLPIDLLGMILSSLEPSFETMYNRGKTYPGFFHAVNKGIEKGFDDYQKVINRRI